MVTQNAGAMTNFAQKHKLRVTQNEDEATDCEILDTHKGTVKWKKQKQKTRFS